jgi:CubicO group peptidase (beta-lactamase class C family)
MAAMDADSLRRWLAERAASHEFSGVALVWRDGAPVFSYAGGLAHRGHSVPMTETTRFAVASVTKMVTATTARRLVDRGVIRLDQPLVEILPANHRPAALTPDHTLHHLLSHTSGLRSYHDDEDQTWDSFTSCWDRIPTYHIRRPADMLPLFGDLPANGPPGLAYQYADANFVLASLVIEAATGKPFTAAAAEEVLTPAGLRDSAFEALDQDPPRLATGYLHTSGPYQTWRSNIFSVPANGMPDGGLVTTAADLARLLDALLGGELLSASLLAAMTTPQGPPPAEARPYAWAYGYGMELAVENGQVTILGHGGADPGVSTIVAHHRAAATTIVVLCNHDRGSWAVNLQLAAAFGLTNPRT